MKFSDLIIENGNIITMDSRKPRANAVAIAQDRIIAVGDDEVWETARDGTRYIDLKGKIVLPGFIDCHTHFMQMGVSLAYLDLRGTSSIEEVLRKIKGRVEEAKKGEWIVGSRWDESKWEERRYITRYDIDKVTPNNPVVLRRMDGHLWVTNTRGLEAAGIPKDHPGLERESTGEPTGLLRWGAKDYVAQCISPDKREMMKGLKLAVDEALKDGVSSVNELSGDFRIYREAADSGHLKIRIYHGAGYGSLDALKKIGLGTGFGNDILKIGPVKMFMDGSIGARTAALFGPYTDDQSTSGQLTCTQDDMQNQIKSVHESGSQFAAHAIGDRGIKTLLDAMEKANLKGKYRHRIEHAELMSEELLDQVKKLDVVLSVQPNFIGEWGGTGELYEKRLGQRYKMMNPLKAIIEREIPMAFGSDCMPFGPLYGIWSAVNNPVTENRISIQEAIYAYTLGAAYASFEEEIKGSIEPGKMADMVVLSSNDLPEEKIKDISIEMTIVGGKVLYSRD